MAGLVYDNATGGLSSGSNSLSYSHTVAGTNRVLVVEVASQATTDITVSSVTYNGVTMTQIDTSSLFFAGVTYVRSTLFYLIAPATGANTVAITMSAAASRLAAGAVSYTNADQTTQPHLSAKATGSSSAPSGSITPTIDNTLIVAGLSAFNTTNMGTVSDNSRIAQANGTVAAGVQDKQQTTAAAATLTWSTSQNNWHMILAALKPIPASTLSDDNSVKASIVATTPQANQAKANIEPKLGLATKANIKTTYYTGDTYDWNPSTNTNPEGQNRGFNS